jgi:polyisoprenoid-binding protein YceI
MRYELDPDRSTVSIEASSSIHPIHTSAAVTGWFEVSLAPDGTIDPSQPIGGAVQLDISGMRSGNPLIDRESERRLDVRRHPTVDGELTRLEGTDDPRRFTAAGDLTFHGVTRSISGELVLDWSSSDDEDDGHDELGLAGATTIDVTDFGVQPPSLLVVKVHKEVTIELHARGVRVG